MRSLTRTPRTLVVVPAYNEEATLGGVLEALARDLPDADVVVVDDGSRDATAAIARGHGVTVLALPFNLGIGGAVQTGMLFAQRHAYDRLLQVDADGQHLPSEARKLFSVLDDHPETDVVCGSRFLGPGERAPVPISRRTGIHIFAFVLSWVVGDRVSDPTSGFRLYNRRAIDLFAQHYPTDYPEVEAVMLLHQRRLRMREVRVTMRARGGGVSSIGSGKSVYYMVKVLLAVGVGLLRVHPAAPPQPRSGEADAAEQAPAVAR